MFIKAFGFPARAVLFDDQDTELLRAELFSIEQLKRHAVTLAGQHRIDPRPGSDRLLSRLADNQRVLLAAYAVVTATALPGQRLLPAEAWLLDNFYLIEQQIIQARRHLPRGYSRQLPRLATGPSAGVPRIYDLAIELISHMDGRVDSDNSTQFVTAYQSVSALQLGELWAFPIMLQLALLENLRRVASRIAQRRQERDAAITWAARMLATAEQAPKQLIQLLAEFADANVPLTAAFVEEFYARLQAQGSALGFIQTWVEQKLLDQGVTATQLSAIAAQTAATHQISIANSIGSLRFIGAMDWRDYVESLSVVEQILREDPAAMHCGQDFATRDRYRHIVEAIARRCAHSDVHSEVEVARQAIVMAQRAAEQLGAEDRSAHVGYYLLDRGRPALECALGCCVSWYARTRRALRRFRLAFYLTPIVLLSVLVTALGLLAGEAGTDWRAWLFAVPGLIAASALAVPLVNRLVTLWLPPRALPRMDFSAGIPVAHRTMVVVPTLLSTAHAFDDLLESLEIRYLGNRDPNLWFALLTDFPDAPTETLPSDAALLTYAQTALETLNQRYHAERPGVFYWLHRPRRWNPHENVWMGYERKRGKLEQFNALLRGGDESAFMLIVGDKRVFSSIQYVITLDTDTQLPRDAAHALVGNLAHPLNRPLYDAVQQRVVEGYAILQPRTAISLSSAGQSRFSQLFAGESGIDPYSREVSDVYQDVFGEGSFVGKGIYAVDAFRQAVSGRFPDNLILSHDLLEGAYARAALVTDIDLIEEHPASYVVEASRRHRWIRGDWQVAGWLLARVAGKSDKNPNPLSALSRWKLFDNLRRSVVSPALLLLFVGGALFASGAVWMWLALAVIFLPALLGILIDFVRQPKERDWRTHLYLTRHAAINPLARALLTLVLLPYDALLCLDAIRVSGLRMLFTRRGLLLWQLPAYARRNVRRSLLAYLREMWVAPVLAGGLGVALWDSAAGSGWLVVVALWGLSPLLVWWLSRPLPAPVANLSADQRAFLRTSARRTWRYFDEFVNADHHWLPPDNFQEYPAPVIAARTSPTNIGMGLLANLSAHDFGYIGTKELLQNLDNTLATLAKLERYRGHFYNWYATETLKPLSPQYVSAVDSGNLAGCLLTLQGGLAELPQQTVLSANALQGLRDTFQVLAEHLPPAATPDLAHQVKALQSALTLDAPPTWRVLVSVLETAHRLGSALLAWLPTEPDRKRHHADLLYWAQAFAHQARALHEELQWLPPPYGDALPTLAELAANPAYPIARQRLMAIADLRARCQQLAQMDFAFLYDQTRHLLSIGYDVGERRRDPSCYDLLASEARLASFLLIAQGQVPQKHWFALGRLLTSHGGAVSLISWSGSMFEYLMPQLLMPSYPHTLLEQTCRAAVWRQIEYGRQRAVPWGISESGYNATDIQQTYQYRAFGVPGLGFKRGLGDDLVIAPYASALALTVLPRDACRNLQRLAELGFLAAYGFYEAIDYTPARLLRGKNYAVVRSFMAHHQGMSLLAFAQVLLDQPMQRRFMSDPQVQATALLLQERVPKRGATLHPHTAEVTAAARPLSAEDGAIIRSFSDPNTPIPEVHLLSNGRYHVMATHAGGGYSRWHDLALSRWREDATRDDWGSFIYLRDRDNGRYWSSAYQPTRRQAEHYEAIFVQARAEYRRLDQAIESHTEICVSPEDDVEIRRLTLTNLSSRTRYIEVTSYAEVVLAPLSADLAHRAFSNLFVQSEILADRQAILCTRRPRSAGESVPWLFHLLAAPGTVCDEASYETDRAQFIGRGRSTAAPLALTQRDPARLSNSAGAVLDPIMAIRCTLTLEPDQSATLQFITGIAESRAAALPILDKYCDRHFVERAFEMAWFQSQEVLRHLSLSEADAQRYGRLASSVIFSTALRRAAPSVIIRNQLGQAGLWRFAVSGDLPIVLLRISDLNRIDLVKQVLQAHAYWRMKGLSVDLVIINEDFSSYRALLQDLIISLLNAGSDVHSLGKLGGVFVLRVEELSEDERVLFQTVARVVFNDSDVSLGEQVRMPTTRMVERFESPRPTLAKTAPPLPPRERIFCNGLGGFTPDGREYVITLEPGQTTPAPWVNVIASPHIGTVVSESGNAYTWVENAHEFRLTPWHNDPLSDHSGEAFYLRDEDSGAFWSPSAAPARGTSGYVCRHGFGYSVFEHEQAGIVSEMYSYVAMDAPVKFAVIKLHNQSGRSRRLSLTGYWELVLGQLRHANLMHIVSEIDPHSGALFAHNAYDRECAKRVMFAQVSERDRTLSGNRTEFIGRNGSLSHPAAMRYAQLSGKTGAGLDPCAAIQTTIELDDQQERDIVFIFGAARNNDEARHFIQRFSGPVGARQALEAVWGYWNHTLGAVHVETPDRALNVLTNGWLVYQTLSCRLWGRSGYYQSGGAYGFRDQLQDSMALLHTTPWLAREQLLRCAERQFLQGDVQHWWHPPNGQGVRTHFSDDYLWLPYVTCHYVQTTGDTGILDESVLFLEGRELSLAEEAYYDQPQRSSESASLYEHCVRAIKHGLRFGVHQLPLMGCGDWNDGMNRVGHEGKGESVWLGWFLYENLQRFAALAQHHDDADFAEFCQNQAETLRLNIETHAWDGAWYRRAYFDDGTPLGSASNDECQIDSISQSWAVISGGGDSIRARQAMNAIDQRLVHRDTGIIQLLDPPFDKSALEPGYIKGYLPGVRENGGQYSHAAIWAATAFAQLGDNQRAWELFTLLNPIHHGSEAADIARYKVEPYVMCADLYAIQPHIGRGGWTWYTGAAGWMYRLSLETLLGLRREGEYLYLTPCIPADWDSYKIHYRYQDTFYHITVKRASSTDSGQGAASERGVRVDGVDCAGRIALVDDRLEHYVEVGV
jgi:cyclic beta-1,2-glucan synthetase